MANFYLTTAIDYANSTPHLGTAFEKIGADVIARYRRFCGDDVYFLMGNDEHSQNVRKKAEELGKDPKTYCDHMAKEFQATWKALHISNDFFIQTSNDPSTQDWMPMDTLCVAAAATMPISTLLPLSVTSTPNPLGRYLRWQVKFSDSTAGQYGVLKTQMVGRE